MGWFIVTAVILGLFLTAPAYKKFYTSGVTENYAGYVSHWNVYSHQFEVSKDGKTIALFTIPQRPLAVWYRPKTQTMVLIASEKGGVNDNHLLYVWKNSQLHEIYHAVVGYSQKNKTELQSWLYPVTQREGTASNIYLTPNEEYLLARETNGFGYSPRVFRVGVNGLVSGQSFAWNPEDTYWSPTSRCLIVMGTEAEDGWGRFVEPNNFVYFTNYITNVVNRSDIQVRWKSEDPCEGYLSVHGDRYGGEGAPTTLDATFYYVFGEKFVTRAASQYGVQELQSLPKDYATLAPSLTDTWLLIMATYTQ